MQTRQNRKLRDRLNHDLVGSMSGMFVLIYVDHVAVFGDSPIFPVMVKTNRHHINDIHLIP